MPSEPRQLPITKTEGKFERRNLLIQPISVTSPSLKYHCHHQWRLIHRHLKGPPPRRWYKAKFGLEYSPETNDNIIKKSGENGETTEDFDFGALTKDHYCRYREAGTEREGQCCTEEDDHCYTKVKNSFNVQILSFKICDVLLFVFYPSNWVTRKRPFLSSSARDYFSVRERFKASLLGCQSSAFAFPTSKLKSGHCILPRRCLLLTIILWKKAIGLMISSLHVII